MMTSSEIQSYHIDMVSNLKKRGEAVIDDLTPQTADLLHMAVGFSGEVAELMACLQPVFCQTASLDRENLIEELGDMEFYLQGIREILGLPRVDVSARLIPDLLPRKLSIDLVIQAGEILDLVKKASIYAKPIDAASIAVQLALVEMVLENLRRIMNVSRDECLTHNLDKLGKRYPGFEYTNKRAQERADKQ